MTSMTVRVQQTQLRLGKKLQRLRKARGWTQEAFAETLHISRTHMGHIEQGRAAPSLKLLTKLAKALNVPVSELF
jgi:transcriptional regulator with XRE-family HTH domain